MKLFKYETRDLQRRVEKLESEVKLLNIAIGLQNALLSLHEMKLEK